MAVILLDQATKFLARASLVLGEAHLYWGGLLRIELAENPGAFLSLGASWPPWVRTWVFQGGVIVFLIWTVWSVGRKDKRWLTHLGLNLLLSGGLANLIDRVWKDSVTDFLVLGWGPLRTGVFNIADMAIMAGVILLIWKR